MNDEIVNKPLSHTLINFQPGLHSKVCVSALETYAYARREAIVLDLITLVSAVEYADRLVQRSTRHWSRSLELHVPVYEVSRWRNAAVSTALHNVLNFLTGDTWQVVFEPREGEPIPKPQDTLPFDTDLNCVMAYSDGLDSRAVAHIYPSNPRELMRVRVGSKANAGIRQGKKVLPFTGIPYELKLPKGHRESSARSRGLKFAITGGVAAYLLDIQSVIVPESGQGVFGPALIPVGRSYADYRNHPLFTSKVEDFLRILLNHNVKFMFPRIWNTKGETLREYAALGKEDWTETRSCWQDSRWCSVNKKRRHCGICAACFLRRITVHSAGLTEPNEQYICERLNSATLEGSLAPGFKLGKTFREYAIAGALQMEHFALEADDTNLSKLRRHASMVAPTLEMSTDEAMEKLVSLIQRHAIEWQGLLDSSGSHSFLNKWVRG